VGLRTVPRQAAPEHDTVMLGFQWNALRTGDHVLVHDDLTAGFDLGEGIVTLIDTRAGQANDIAIRLTATGELLRPRRHAVHLLPLDHRFTCWRCNAIASHATPSAPVADAA
jgi:hypothetical protein